MIVYHKNYDTWELTFKGWRWWPHWYHSPSGKIRAFSLLFIHRVWISWLPYGPHADLGLGPKFDEKGSVGESG